MRCYFMKDGRIENVELLKHGSDDALIQQAQSLFQEHAARSSTRDSRMGAAVAWCTDTTRPTRRPLRPKLIFARETCRLIRPLNWRIFSSRPAPTVGTEAGAEHRDFSHYHHLAEHPTLAAEGRGAVREGRHRRNWRLLGTRRRFAGSFSRRSWSSCHV
jgi:hypothetical protein